MIAVFIKRVDWHLTDSKIAANNEALRGSGVLVRAPGSF
jgi:hypothetical protein